MSSISARPRRPPAPAKVYVNAWAVAQSLRVRKGWALDEAFLERFWSVRRGSTRFRISAHASFFFIGIGDRPPGVGIALAVVFSDETPAASVDAIVKELQSLLGGQFRHERRERHTFVRVLRTESPRDLVGCMDSVAVALGDRKRPPLARAARTAIGRRWQVVETLRDRSWLISGLGFSRLAGNEKRRLYARLGVTVASSTGEPGIAADFGGWVPRTSARWRSLHADVASVLTTSGFKDVAGESTAFHFLRFQPGLENIDAAEQAQLFEVLLRRGAPAIRTPRSDPR